MARKRYGKDDLKRIGKRLSAILTRMQALMDLVEGNADPLPALCIQGEQEMRRGLKKVNQWVLNGHKEYDDASADPKAYDEWAKEEMKKQPPPKPGDENGDENGAEEEERPKPKSRRKKP